MNTLTPLIERYLKGRVRRCEISEQTAIDTRYRLDRLARSFGRRPLEQWGPKAIDRWLGTMSCYAPSTRREHLSAARGFARWLVTDPRTPVTADATAHVKPIRQPRRTPITLSRPEVAALLAAAPDARARAILWLMIGCGCRRVEVSRLNVEDYTPNPGGGGTIRLVGKGGHERIIAVPKDTATAIDAYLDVRGRVAGPLVVSREGNARLKPHTISVYVHRWMTAAGLKARAYDGRSPHGLRRTAASDVMDRSGNLRAVQEMLGHASIHTTAAHYLRPVTMEQLREAMEGRDYSPPEAQAS